MIGHLNNHVLQIHYRVVNIVGKWPTACWESVDATEYYQIKEIKSWFLVSTML